MELDRFAHLHLASPPELPANSEDSEAYNLEADSASHYYAEMANPNGFEYSIRGSDIVITHHGKVATTLRGNRASDFLEDVEHGDAQLLMARMTGNYKHGNERQARRHPRNG